MNTIQHTCGHASSWPDTEPNRDAKLRTQRCPHCRKTAGRENYLRKVQAAQQEANEHGWPALTGSQRAVNWALVLRSEALAQFEQEQQHPTPGTRSVPDALAEHYKHILTRETRAGRWIDARSPANNTQQHTNTVMQLVRQWATSSDLHQARRILRDGYSQGVHP